MGELVKVCLASNPVVQASVFIPEGTKWPTLKGLIADRLGLPNFRIHHVKLISTNGKSGELTDTDEIKKFLAENSNKGVICMVHEDTNNSTQSSPSATSPPDHSKLKHSQNYDKLPKVHSPGTGESSILDPNKFRKSLAELMADIDNTSKSFEAAKNNQNSSESEEAPNKVKVETFRVRMAHQGEDKPSPIQVMLPSGCSWYTICTAVADRFGISNPNSIQDFILYDKDNKMKQGPIVSATHFWQIFSEYKPDYTFEVHTGGVLKATTIDNAVFSPPRLTNNEKPPVVTTPKPTTPNTVTTTPSRLETMDDLVGIFHVKLATDPTKHAEISVVTDCTWEELVQSIAAGYFGLIKPHSVQTLVLVDSEGDEMSGLIATSEKFWSVYGRHKNSGSLQKPTFYVHLEPVSKNAAKAVAIEKAREAARAKVKKRLEEDVRGKHVVTEIHKKIDEIQSDVERLRSAPNENKVNSSSTSTVTSTSQSSTTSSSGPASNTTKTVHFEKISTSQSDPSLSNIATASTPSSQSTSGMDAAGEGAGPSTTNSSIKPFIAQNMAMVMEKVGTSSAMSLGSELDSVSKSLSASSTGNSVEAPAVLLSATEALDVHKTSSNIVAASSSESTPTGSRNKFRATKKVRAAAVAETKLKEAMAKSHKKRDGNDTEKAVVPESPAAAIESQLKSTVSAPYAAESPSSEAHGNNTHEDVTPLASVTPNHVVAGVASKSVVTDKSSDSLKADAIKAKFCIWKNRSSIVEIPISTSCRWEEVKQLIGQAFGVEPSRIDHFFLIDDDGDEMSPMLNSTERFMKFLSHYSELDSMSFSVVLDEHRDQLSPGRAFSNEQDSTGKESGDKKDGTLEGSTESGLSPQDLAFRKACCEGDLAAARKLLSQGVDVYAKDTEGHQAMHLACISGHLEIVQWLVGMGVSLLHKDNNGMTPLHHACDGTHVSVSLFLVKSGANMLVEDNAGLTPLHCIALQGLIQLAHLLRPHITTLRSSSGLTLLHCACNGGHEEMVTYLLKNKARIIVKDNEGMSPLHHACLNGHFGVARMLVEYGAYHSSRDNEGMSPLLYACSEGHLSIVQWLTSIGASVFVRNNFKDGALHLACQGGLFELTKWLVMNGIPLNLKNHNGQTAYDIAHTEGHTDICEFLQSYSRSENGVLGTGDPGSADAEFEENLLRQKEMEEEKALVEKATSDYTMGTASSTHVDDADGIPDDSSVISTGNETFSSTPGVDTHFRECCAKGDVVTVMRMLALGISPEACSANGSKPLHFACAGGHMEIVQELVRMGASINVVNFKGSSPLHFACYWQHEALCVWLIRQGAELTTRNADGFTPLHYICMLGQSSLLRQIVDVVNRIDLDASHPTCPPLLHCASDHGHVEIIQVLADLGANIDSLDSQGRAAIHFACRSGELSTVQALLQNNANMDIKDKEGHTAILTACYSKKTELVNWLATQGASLYSSNFNGDTCLHIACRVGSLSLVQWLCERGADIMIKNNDFLTPGELASKYGHHDVASWITHFTNKSSLGATSDEPQDQQSQSESELDEDLAEIGVTRDTDGLEMVDEDEQLPERPEFIRLKEYCMNGDIDAVMEIVKAGGDVNMENRNGSTVMHFASASGHLKLCRKLLEMGVSPNKENNLGLTPFHCACINGHLALVKWFYLQTAGNLSDMTADGRTALHHACYNGHVNIVEWLIKSGADLKVLNLDELTPFHDACYGGHISVVAFLVNQGMNVMTTNYAGVTPLHVASEQGHLELVQWLVAEGAVADCADEYERTPFLNACLHGHLNVAKWLADQGVDVLATGGVSDRLNSALHLACQNGHMDVAKWLIELGLDLNAMNDHHETPLQFAMAGRHYELAKWLLTQRFSYLDNTMKSEEYPEITEALAENDKSKVIYLLEKVCTESSTVKFLKDVNPLHFLCASGDLELVQFYLRANPAAVNSKNCVGITPLHCAAAKGHVNIVIFLLQYGADIESRDVEGSTAFILSMYMQHAEVCQLLFAEHMKSNVVDYTTEMNQSITIAESVHHTTSNINQPSKLNPAIIRTRHRADDRTVDCRVTNPSIFSCIVPESPSRTIVNKQQQQQLQATQHKQLLMDETQSTLNMTNSSSFHMNKMKSESPLARVNPNEEFDFSGGPFHPAIQDACLACDLNCVRELVTNGTNVNARNPANASTPLHFACVSGDMRIVKFLLENGAKIDVRNVGGMTPCHIACDRKHSTLVLYLLRHGADSSCRNKVGDTPLHYLASRDMGDVLNKLIELPSLVKNFDLGVKSLQGLTPLHTAVEQGNIEIADILTKKNSKIDVNERDDESRTPLHYAALKGHLDIVEMLWRRGGDINAKDDKSRTALLYACISGHFSILQWLVRHGADPHAVTDNGNGALHAACRYGDLKMVIWLVEIGVDVTTPNFEKITPLQYAAQGGFNDVVNWLADENLVNEYAGCRRNEIKKDISE